jgi:hypothetical protein
MSNERSRLRDSLIPGTIDNASKIPFYERLYASIDLSTVSVADDLIRLPVVDKALFRAEYENEPRPDAEATWITHTMATTGDMTFRYRGAAELQFLRDFQQHVTERTRDPSLPAPLSLQLGMGYHGNAQSFAPSDLLLVGSVDMPETLEHVIGMLGREYRLSGRSSRITQLECSRKGLEVLTGALLARGIDPATLGVRVIRHTGDYLPAPMREFFARVWGQPELVNRYSLSEIIGGATECTACGTFHVDPQVVAEVLHPVTRKPVNGSGVLVLTELFPFSQYQPLIRYWTGDMVESVEPDCDRGSPSFRFLGRLQWTPHQCDGDRVRIYLRPALLQDRLEAIPEIARSQLPPLVPQSMDYRLGPPYATVRVHDRVASGPIIDIEIGLSFVPELHPNAAAAVVARVRNEILDDNPELAEVAAMTPDVLRIVARPARRDTKPMTVIGD